MTVRTYQLTKDAYARYISWRTKLSPKGLRRIGFKPWPTCYACGGMIRQNEMVTYKSGRTLGHIYHRKCARKKNVM